VAGALGDRLGRSFFAREVTEVARDLLGRIMVARSAAGDVAVRLTEVEAYAGTDDPASHAFRGRTPRTAVMFGPPGHLYTYFVYGMHWCANVVTGPDGDASAVLLRAGDVIAGRDLAGARRPAVTRPERLTRGPAGLATVLGLGRDASGADLCGPDGRWEIRAGEAVPPERIASGPRVGVAAAGEVALRFWDTAAPSVSDYRVGGRLRRRPGGGPPAIRQNR
jgi:DNA-3-methyladenine glycosylase